MIGRVMLRFVRTTVLCVFAASMAAALHDREAAADYEGWIATGNAFDNQPVASSMFTTDRFAPVTVGGDYWKSQQYPVGEVGRSLISTLFPNGDAATGTFTSPPMILDATTPYFSALIGGTGDAYDERVELRIDGGAVVTIASDGHDTLTRKTLRIPDALLGREARIVIVDGSPTGHVNVDALAFTTIPPESRPAPVWGYADYHTHPMNHLAFGGLKGARVIWGSPGGNYDDYCRNPSLALVDLPRCTRGHGGGPFANPFLNASQTEQAAPSASVLFFAHGQHGAPEFDDWPSFIAGAHQQMHITQIRRNYDGGLRLMVAFATDNLGAEYVTSKVQNGHVDLVKERDSVEAQLAAIIDLAHKNKSWMEIAYSPDDARRIILGNRLAVVLGVEADQLGTYDVGTPRDEVEYLWSRGVRMIVPIHAANNKLGGAAAFLGPYNWLNDLLHRDHFDMTKDELARYPARFFEVAQATCDPADADNDGECVQFRFEWDKQSRLYIGPCPILFVVFSFGSSPCLETVKVPEYFEARRGHKNRKGLTRFGEEYLEAIMDRGMMLDTAHMSDASVTGTFDLIGARLARQHPECAGMSFATNLKPGCERFVYPASISHAHFRSEAFFGQKEFPPSEYDIGNRNLNLVKQVGGAVGPFTAEPRVSVPWDPSPAAEEGPFDNDCALSSKSFGYSYHFARQHLGASGVAMATDFTFIPGVAPRFGRNACWGYHLAIDPDAEHRDHPGRYSITAQANGVVYKNRSVHKDVRPGKNEPLTYYQLGDRVFDFNVDGMSHFGLVPDMLQDLKNLSFPPDEFEALFSSAEAYIRMWEHTRAVATIK